MSRCGRYLMTGVLILVACVPDPAPTTGPSFQQCQFDCDPPPPPPPLPLTTFTAVAMGRGNFNHLQVVLLGTDGRLYLHYQGHESGAWTWVGSGPFQVPAGITFDKIATGHGYDNNLHVVARRVNDRLYVLHQSSATGAWYWDGVLPETRLFTAFTTASGNGLQVVGPSLSGSGQLMDTYQSGGPWLQNWFTAADVPSPPAGPFTAVASAICSDACSPWLHTDIIALRAVDGGANSGLPCLWMQPWGQGQTWQHLDCRSNPHGETFRDVATGKGNQNQPHHVMLSATSGRPYLYYMTTGGVWIASGYLPNPNQVGFARVAVGRGNNDNLQVVGVGLDGKPYLIWQASGTGAWSWYGPLPNPENRQFTALAMAEGDDDNLQVVLIGTDGLAYVIYQVSGSGNWIWGGRLQTQ